MLVSCQTQFVVDRDPGELEPEVAIPFLREMEPAVRQTRRRLEEEHVADVDLVTLDPGESVAELVVETPERANHAEAGAARFLLGLANRPDRRLLALVQRARRDLDAGLEVVAMTEDEKVTVADDVAEHFGHAREGHARTVARQR